MCVPGEETSARKTIMELDVQGLWDGVLAFYLSLNVLGALVGTVPGALVERKSCATLERAHFLMFFFFGAAVLGYLHFEITRAVAADGLWLANLGMAVVAGLYLGNVTARRLRNIAWKPVLALLIWVPVVNMAFLAAMALIPTAPKKARIAAGVKSAAGSADSEASSPSQTPA